MPGRSDCQIPYIQRQRIPPADPGGNQRRKPGQRKEIAELISEPLSKADADFVRDKTGFAIGGVPPLAHAQPIRIFIDEDLLKYDEIWAAAGTPKALFKLTPQELQKITSGQVVSVK